MISESEIAGMVDGYGSPTVGVLGSHSALEVMDGAKDEGFPTIVLCQKGRETPYKRFRRIADKLVILDRFDDMLKTKVQEQLRNSCTIIVPHRSLTAYLGYPAIEDRLKLPILGNRALFQAEERDHPKNQYYLLKKARIKYPRVTSDPKDITSPSIVKVQEKGRRLERAFFTVSSYADYRTKSEAKIKSGMIDRSELERASIEELAIGTYMNFNYFHTPLSKYADFLGIERRLQTQPLRL